jgi:sporulation protein YlmC with PRC-barrel domain
MDVARDLVDRQLVDRDGRECGRIDDVWIEWDDDDARLGPLVSGAAIVLDQLGAAGRLLKHIGGARARRSRTIEWASVAGVERSRVLLACNPAHTTQPQPCSLCRRRYSAITGLAVIDAAGERRGVLDLRSATALGGAAPSILGLIACRRTWLRTLGMKRYDATGVPLADIQDHARFVPWNAIAALDNTIRLRVAFADLPRLDDAPDPGPPPLAPAPEKP